jgi:hypothetical protein
MDENHRLSDTAEGRHRLNWQLHYVRAAVKHRVQKPIALTAAEFRQLTGQIAALPSRLPEDTQ